MNGILLRVGVDLGCGGYNAPCDTETGDYVYVPIPESKHAQKAGLETGYDEVLPVLESWFEARGLACNAPPTLKGKKTHLDPDFENLTYGEQSRGRGVRLSKLEQGDFISFYGAFRDCRSQKLIYCIFGIFEIEDVYRIGEANSRGLLNAHTRRLDPEKNDLVIVANPSRSGRLNRLIPIGGWRNRAYRVFEEYLERWGDITVKDGWIQRSVNPPFFKDPERFMAWFDEYKRSHGIRLLHTNYS